jgi:hypothetical protein
VVETDFYTALCASAVTAICGTRIYPLALPTDPTLPAIDYRFVGGANQPTMSTDGVQRYRVEVNCWGNTYSDAVSLRYAVVKALSGYQAGTMNIQYLMPQDLFDEELLQCQAMAEFYVYDAMQ